MRISVEAYSPFRDVRTKESDEATLLHPSSQAFFDRFLEVGFHLVNDPLVRTLKGGEKLQAQRHKGDSTAIENKSFLVHAPRYLVCDRYHTFWDRCARSPWPRGRVKRCDGEVVFPALPPNVQDVADMRGGAGFKRLFEIGEHAPDELPAVEWGRHRYPPAVRMAFMS